MNARMIEHAQRVDELMHEILKLGDGEEVDTFLTALMTAFCGLNYKLGIPPEHLNKNLEMVKYAYVTQWQLGDAAGTA